jgi:hypothetical protein
MRGLPVDVVVVVGVGVGGGLAVEVVGGFDVGCDGVLLPVDEGFCVTGWLSGGGSGAALVAGSGGVVGAVEGCGSAATVTTGGGEDRMGAALSSLLDEPLRIMKMPSSTTPVTSAPMAAMATMFGPLFCAARGAGAGAA